MAVKEAKELKGVLYRAREDILKLGESKIRCISFGNGERPLVMIQGLNTRSIKGMAMPLAFAYRLFAKEYRVYLFDRPSRLFESITVRDLAASTASAMDVLGLKDADVLGVSQGGMIAQYLAIDRPDLVRKMVLAVTLSKNNPVVEDAIQKWTKLTIANDFKTMVADMAERMYTQKYVRRYKLLMPLLVALQKPSDIPRFLTLAKACLTCNAYDELEKIMCPTLVIGATEDRVVGAEASYEIAEKLGCEIFMYEKLGHAAYEEAKDFNRRVLDFFQDISEISKAKMC